MDQAVEEKPKVEPPVEPGRPVAAPRLRLETPAPRRSALRRRRRGLSPLTVRVLAVNALALVILAAGLLYLDRYQQSLTEGEFDALEVQARLIAGALGEGATELTDAGAPGLDYPVAQALVRRLAEPTSGRVRLFDANGNLVVDSQLLGRQGGLVQVTPLPEIEPTNPASRVAIALYEWVFNWWPRRDDLPAFPGGLVTTADALPEAEYALGGEVAIAAYA
ncbi:MAG: stimulus-sensing domain-containing protein, partial [Proteobacteria bacterium]|nr:stimulus-sensing domain-containing protein [Pseudomonadota bacterium]